MALGNSVGRVVPSTVRFFVSTDVKPVAMASSYVGIYMHGSTPDGNVTAPASSICLTPNGVYFKESGCDDANWVKL